MSATTTRSATTIRAALAAASLATLLVAAAASPAQAREPQIRVGIDIEDMAGQPVAGVDIEVSSSVETVTVTTNEWGGANARIEVAPGDDASVQVDHAGVNDPSVLLTDVDDRDRFDLEFTTNEAEGFTLVREHWDFDGDGVTDDVWHQPAEGEQDTWLFDFGGDGKDAREVRLAPYEVVAHFAVDFDGVPGRELIVVEQAPWGPYRAYVYSAVEDDDDRINLGSLPALDILEDDLDGDGIRDVTFYGPTSDGWEFVIMKSSGGVERVTLGDADSYFFPEPTDINGGGVADLFVSSVIPGVAIRWSVWEAETSTINVVDVGTHGETVFDATLLDGDGDGLPEFLSAFEVPGDGRGWEVYEYATGDYFEVILGPEDDRGPSSIHYPSDW